MLTITINIFNVKSKLEISRMEQSVVLDSHASLDSSTRGTIERLKEIKDELNSSMLFV